MIGGKFDGLDKKLGALARPVVVEPVRTYDVPDGAGVAGARSLAIQVAFRQSRGKVLGASAKTMNGAAHRLEVTRWYDMPEGGLDPDRERRLLWTPDGSPERRLSLLMPAGGPPGFRGNLRPWAQAFNLMGDAINSIAEHMSTLGGDTRYGIVAVVMTSHFETISGDASGKWAEFDEARVCGLVWLETVKLIPAEETEQVRLPPARPGKVTTQRRGLAGGASFEED